MIAELLHVLCNVGANPDTSCIVVRKDDKRLELVTASW